MYLICGILDQLPRQLSRTLFSDPDPLLCGTTESGIEIRIRRNMKQLFVRENKPPMIEKADRLTISNEHGRTKVSFIWLLFRAQSIPAEQI